MRESARIYRTSAKARYSRGAFARQTGLIRARLLASTILESDETGARVGKQTWWIWVFHHGVDARFVIHKNRSRAVVEGFLGAYRPDFWVSDRLPSQMNWAKKDHQVCLAHLIRDAQYAIDAGDGAFAPGLRRLLQRACAIGERREQLADAPTHAAGKKVHKAIKGCRRYLFVFLADRAIPPTNNGCEQAPLRHLPQGDKLLPFPMGRKSLRRCSIRHRNRAAPRYRGSRSHPPHLEWNAVARPGPAPIRVSNYQNSACIQLDVSLLSANNAMLFNSWFSS
jgi:hypothetical protein